MVPYSWGTDCFTVGNFGPRDLKSRNLDPPDISRKAFGPQVD